MVHDYHDIGTIGVFLKYIQKNGLTNAIDQVLGNINFPTMISLTIIGVSSATKPPRLLHKRESPIIKKVLLEPDQMCSKVNFIGEHIYDNP
ncbi:hypothetical protein [Niallia taxi]|uniref:hypothetical protein n=1 Tax=Niallia taxi TaxID=2499688 RepID=UPI003D28D1E5